MKKVALYCRVSTSSQERQETIETQLAKLKEVYKEESIIKVYTDVCSGAYLQREGLNQLRKDAKNVMFDIIAVYSLDRLSRKLGHQIALMEEFEKQGVKVKVLDENYENTPEGILNRNIRGAFSEYERYKIAQRMRDGKYRKANNDDYVWGTPPYGYKIVKKDGKRKLEIDPQEAKMIKAIFNVYLEEHGLGKTAKRIYDMGFRARTKRRGKYISLSSFMISKILENEVYIGNFYYGKTYPCEPENPVKKAENRKTMLSSRKYRPKSEWKLMKIPAIIDKATFERVQKIKKERAKSPLKPTRNYLLQGLIKCVHCGYRYIGKIKSKSHREEAPNGCHFSYICPCKASRRRPDKDYCHSREISTNKIDNVVWEYVSALIRDKEKLKKAVRDSREQRESKREFNQKIYDSLMTQKAEIKKEKSRILGLYGKENLKEEDLDEKMSELNSQEEDLERQIKEVERELAKIEEINTIEKEIEQACLEYENIIDDADFELKRRILKRWVKEINLPDEGGILVKMRLPQPKKPIKFKFSEEKIGVASIPQSR